MQVERMRQKLCNLPKRDQSIGEQFIQSRDFESLRDLVDSAIYKTKRSINSENPKQEYLEVDLDELNKFKVEIDIYLEQLFIPSNENDEDEDDDLREELYEEFTGDCLECY